MARAAPRREIPLPAILALACVLRLGWALCVDANPRTHFRFDATYYDAVARNLVAGMGFAGYEGQPTALSPPAYPFALSILYHLFDESLLAAKLLNVLAGTLTVLLTYLLAGRLYGPRVATAAALLLAIFPGDIYYASLTMSEPLFTTFFLAILYLFVSWNVQASRVSAVRWLAFGALLGLTTLIRGVGLLFFPVPVTLWLLTTGFTRSTLQKALLSTLAFLAVVLPWTVRNHAVMGRPILISTDGAFSMFDSHSPAAGLPSPDTSRKLQELRRRVFGDLLSLPQPRREAEMSKAEARYAIDYIRHHPLEELRRVPARVAALGFHDHWALDMSMSPRRSTRDGRVSLRIFGPRIDRMFSRIATLYFFALVPFALIGAVRAFRHSERNGLILPLTVLLFLLIHGFLVYGSPRYHAPLAPVIAILAAWGLPRFCGTIDRADARELRVGPP